MRRLVCAGLGAVLVTVAAGCTVGGSTPAYVPALAHAMAESSFDWDPAAPTVTAALPSTVYRHAGLPDQRQSDLAVRGEFTSSEPPRTTAWGAQVDLELRVDEVIAAPDETSDETAPDELTVTVAVPEGVDASAVASSLVDEGAVVAFLLHGADGWQITYGQTLLADVGTDGALTFRILAAAGPDAPEVDVRTLDDLRKAAATPDVIERST